MIKNAAGRQVPARINGSKAIPFAGVNAHRPEGRTAGRPIPCFSDYPPDGDKRVADLRTALEKCGLADGMTVSTHHHLRDGDLIACAVFDVAAEMGVKDLVWLPSASFPCHAPIIKHLDSGVVHHIEGSMNGPLGDYCSHGKMKGTAVLRSHGGRYTAIQDGEVHLDIAVVAAPTADRFGNSNGVDGPSACGPLAYAHADSEYADRVIVVTDNLVDFPCRPVHVPGHLVDCVVEVERIGDASRIVSGTTQITRSPDRLRIADLAARFVHAAGLMRPGFNFQTGAGGTPLAFTESLRRIMQREDIRAGFYLGGSNRYPVKMLEDDLLECIFDIQAFDLEAVRSLRENPRHLAMSPFHTYNFHGKGNYASMLDFVVLGATEVDVGFNANVVTHSDGRLLHGIGGWQNCLYAGCTIMAVPSFRDRLPVLVDEVTTLVGPGELVDVVVTERGLCINPRRTDLFDAVKGSGLPVLKIEELKEQVERICGGKPDKPAGGEKIVAGIKWVDGTLIDCVRQV